MEAATLKKKSTGLSKGKLKKTIKNVLCRPDSINWPVISDENAKDLSMRLSNYKVEIPEFKKLKWEVLKKLPKDERPKPPVIKKPEGFIFGLRDCSETIKNKDCCALLVDSDVNPRCIVQPLIETCYTAKVPVICLKNLKEQAFSNFGIKTACLGVKKGCLEDIHKKITELAKLHALKQPELIQNEATSVKIEQDHYMSDCTNNNEITNYHLKRISKKSRVFVPPSDTVTKEVKKKFIGQDFIGFSGKTIKENSNDLSNPTGSYYKNMKLKRITNNPKRKHLGKKRKIENAKS